MHLHAPLEKNQQNTFLLPQNEYGLKTQPFLRESSWKTNISIKISAINKEDDNIVTEKVT